MSVDRIWPSRGPPAAGRVPGTSCTPVYTVPGPGLLLVGAARGRPSCSFVGPIVAVVRAAVGVAGTRTGAHRRAGGPPSTTLAHGTRLRVRMRGSAGAAGALRLGLLLLVSICWCDEPEVPPPLAPDASRGALAPRHLASGPPPSIRVVEPEDGATYGGDRIQLRVAVDGEFRMGGRGGGVVCIDVTWAQGARSYCVDKLDDWIMGGLEDGNYLATVQLRESDDLASAVVAEARSSFNIQIPKAALLPRVSFSFPTGDGRVFGTSQVDLSFYTTNFPKGSICLSLHRLLAAAAAAAAAAATGGAAERDHSNATLDEAVVNRTCVGAHEHAWRVTLPSGSYRAIAHLHGVATAAPLASRYSSNSVQFRVQLDARPGGGATGAALDGGKTRVGASTAAGGGAAAGRGVSEPAFPYNRPEGSMHIVVMSARVYDRYEEALVMIKSMLFHWRRARVPDGPGITLHLIVDDGGADFFAAAFARLALPLELVDVLYHSYNRVCVRPLEAFLADFEMPMSAHYSGAAGYCRLFMAPYLATLGVPAFVAVESDQLFFDDVTNLWRFLPALSGQAFLRAPEMYQPWEDGRPRGPDEAAAEGHVIRDLDADWHGNGYIGGIMMFNISRMEAAGWEARWKGELRAFIESKGREWVPKLNDQDIFNAVISRNPQWAAPLPCEFNLQYHAYMNSRRICEAQGEALNCEAALQKGIFVCPRHPSVVHFMSQSYLGSDLSYYQSFWHAVAGMSPDLIRGALVATLRRARAYENQQSL